MCGRYTLLADERYIRECFNIPNAIESYQPSYNIAPGQDVLAVIYDGQKNRAGNLRWGLVPSWAEDEKIGYKMINARSETADVKPSFKSLMVRKRCLIIADSFYEWRPNDTSKIPERIQVNNNGLFAFAGLWDKWQKGNKTVFTCTVLTKDANTFMQDIHHRMPIILSEDEASEWLETPFSTATEAKQYLESVDDVSMKSYSVSNYVNHAKHNDEKCIEALNEV